MLAYFRFAGCIVDGGDHRHCLRDQHNGCAEPHPRQVHGRAYDMQHPHNAEATMSNVCYGTYSVQHAP